MQNVPIPDQLYARARQAAEQVGVSFDRFISDAVQLHIHDDLDEPEEFSLTPEQIAIIRKSQQEIKEGKGIPFEQAKKDLIAERAAWLKSKGP